MKLGLTYISMIVDKSGSMFNLITDTIGSYNRYLKEQKELPGEAKLSRTLFSNDVEIDKLIDIQECEELSDKNYSTYGGTALLDAIGKSIDSLGQILNKMPESERPENVVVCILTDGMENASREYRFDTIRQKIEHQQSKYNWKFLFLGANIDSFDIGSSIGIPTSCIANYKADSEGVNVAYSLMSNSTRSIRSNSFLSMEDEQNKLKV